MRKPLDCAYSMNVSLKRGSVGSAFVTTGVRLSGMRTGNTPPKNDQAASSPSITSVVVWPKVSHTNMCRDQTATTMRAWTTRRRPVVGSVIIPILPKSAWSSTPGFPSATRTVDLAAPVPHRSAQNRWSVRSGTDTPRRASRSPILATVRSAFTQVVIRSSSARSLSHDDPCPSGRCGRTASHTEPISSSVSWPSPPSRTRPSAVAASR